MNILCFPIVAALALAGCSDHASKTPERPPLAGARIGGPFALVDQNGHPATERAFAGRYRIMYFGYTFCPDVCPTDVQTIGAALKLFEQRHPDAGRRIVPVFVSVDPARDTPAVLRQFVAAFHPRMVGLTGSDAAIDAIAKEYGVYHHREPAREGGYLVSHSRQSYLMGPGGEPIALLPQEQGADAVARELERWVS